MRHTALFFRLQHGPHLRVRVRFAVRYNTQCASVHNIVSRGEVAEQLSRFILLMNEPSSVFGVRCGMRKQQEYARMAQQGRGQRKEVAWLVSHRPTCQLLLFTAVSECHTCRYAVRLNLPPAGVPMHNEWLRNTKTRGVCATQVAESVRSRYSRRATQLLFPVPTETRCQRLYDMTRTAIPPRETPVSPTS